MVTENFVESTNKKLVEIFIRVMLKDKKKQKKQGFTDVAPEFSKSVK